MNLKQTAGGGRGLRLTAISAALVAAFALPHVANAFEIETGNDDVVMRWDNTVRINIVDRIASQNEAMIKNPNYDDGDRNFDHGHWFERFDVLSEFDFIYKKNTGFRVSAAGWWDPGYNKLDNTSTQTSNHLVNGRPCARPARLHQPLREGRFGRIPRRVRLRQVEHRWSAGQRPARPDDGVLGREPAVRTARSTASRTRRTRSTSGRPWRPRVPKPRNCSVRASA